MFPDCASLVQATQLRLARRGSNLLPVTVQNAPSPAPCDVFSLCPMRSLRLK